MVVILGNEIIGDFSSFYLIVFSKISLNLYFIENFLMTLLSNTKFSSDVV